VRVTALRDVGGGRRDAHYSTAVARALLLVQMTSQQLAALIVLRRGGDPGRRLAVMIGSVMAGVADDAGVGTAEREGARRQRVSLSPALP